METGYKVLDKPLFNVYAYAPPRPGPPRTALRRLPGSLEAARTFSGADRSALAGSWNRG